MDSTEFLTMLQIVELTRDQPKLKVVHDFMLAKCESHVEEIEKQLEALQKAEAEKKAKEEAEKAKAAEAAKPKDNHTSVHTSSNPTMADTVKRF